MGRSVCVAGAVATAAIVALNPTMTDVRPDCDRRRQRRPGRARSAPRSTAPGSLLVESGRLGGTCVNVGCVPKKVMWNAAEIAAGAASDAPTTASTSRRGAHDWALPEDGRDAYVTRLNGIYERNLAIARLDWCAAARASPARAQRGDRRLAHITAPHIVVATGGRPVVPPCRAPSSASPPTASSSCEQRPERVAIVGSGYIAVSSPASCRRWAPR